MKLADSQLEEAKEAVSRHAWQEAYDLLRSADAAGGLQPEEVEMLAEAAWWTGRIDDCIAARERAYAGYVAAGQALRAATVALQLTGDYHSRMSTSVATGFLNRARRLLRDQPEGREHGLLACAVAAAARNSGNLDIALDCAQQALDIAGRSGDRELQALALHEQGQALIAKAHVADGLMILDESMAAAVSDELGPYFTGLLFCGMICACQTLADYRRAGEWVEAADRAFERRAIAVFPGDCRLHRAELLRLRGSWQEAERQAKLACDELRSFDLPHVGHAFYQIGEVRLGIGDLPAAEDAFACASELGRNPHPGLALLRLAQGNVEASVTMITRALEGDNGDRLERARLLAAAVEIAVASQQLTLAHGAADELETIAHAYGTPALEASSACARGMLQLAEGQARDSIQSSRRGWRLWQDAGVPYEAARARALLAAAHEADGDSDAARLELQAARVTFEQLGAVPDASRAAASLAAGNEGAVTARPARDRTAKTFMFTDIVGSTNLVEAIGDEAWEDLLRWHDRSLRSLFAGHGGDEIKNAGDGFFVAFPDSTSAIECAVAVQRTLADQRRTQGFALQIRIGLHTSIATYRGRDYIGKGIHRAARIAAIAEGEEILASQETLALTPTRFNLSEPRAVILRGIKDPVQVASVDWRTATH